MIRLYSWQATDAVGRAEIQAAIDTAEDKLHRLLGYAVGERYTSVAVDWPRANDPAYRPWYARSVVLPDEGFVAALGAEQRTLIGNAAIIYSASAGSPWNDRATVSIATAITDPKRLLLIIPEADQTDQQAADGASWIINPLKVTIAAGVATFTIASWLLVRPELYEGYTINTSNGLDPLVAGNFLTSLDVYDSTVNDNHGTAYYDYDNRCCGISGTDPAVVANGNIRGAIVNGEFAIVNPVVSVYNSDQAVWYAAPFTGCRPPDRLVVNARAGVPRLANGELDREYATVVARLAIAELQGQPCGCKAANHAWYHWQLDISRTSGNDQYAFKEAALNNPLGPRRGHIEAWQFIMDRQHIRSITN